MYSTVTTINTVLTGAVLWAPEASSSIRSLVHATCKTNPAYRGLTTASPSQVTEQHAWPGLHHDDTAVYLIARCLGRDFSLLTEKV